MNLSKFILKNSQIEQLKISGRILRQTLEKIKRLSCAGISTDYLDKIAEREIRKAGAKPSFKNYSEGKGSLYPASICISINDEIVHGIPDKKKVLCEGDLVGLDLGVNYQGIFTDAADTIIIGKSSPKTVDLLKSAEKSLKIAISLVKDGVRVGDIGFAIEKYIKSRKFKVIKSLVGHGIGTSPHQEPQIPNFGVKRNGDVLLKGVAICIEPMVSAGSSDILCDKDGWTLRTKDRSISAHFEKTILVEKDRGIIIA